MKLIDGKSNVKYLIFLAGLIGIAPLIVFAKKISIKGGLAGYWIKELNFFSYYKMLYILIGTFFLVISFLIYLFNERKIKATYYYIILEIYGMLIILSTIFSAYSNISLWGFPDRYEGVFVLLSYLTILFITINLVNYKKDLKFLLATLLISAIIISIIGIFQYFGFDVIYLVIKKGLIIPSSLAKISNEVSIRFDYIYSTLYNPNYVGSYMGMLLPLLIAMYILAKSQKSRLLLGFCSLLIFSNWLGCLSRAGMVAAVFSIFLLLLLLSRDILIKNWYSVFILFISFLVVFIAMDYGSDGRLVREVLSFKKEIKRDSGELKNIIINKDNLSIITEESQLYIRLSSNYELTFLDEKGDLINYSIDDNTGRIKFQDNRYEDYKFKLNFNNHILNFEYSNKEMKFNMISSDEKRFILLGALGRGYTGDEIIEKWGFKNHEGFASHRGYIWSRSIPLLKDTLFTGYGPDTYAFYFPQMDAVGKLLNFGTANIIVDKPHNMYLQIALNTGVLSLLAVLTMFGVYIIESIKLYWKSNFNNFYQQVGVAIFVGIVAYLIAGLFNDSVVSVAPVFWVLFGMGISINHKLKNEIG
jgi:hypothetical protein